MIKGADVVVISRNNTYLGGVRDNGSLPVLKEKPAQWQRFIVETDGVLIAFKQQVSGLYLGGQVQEGAAPQLVPHKKEWQMFRIESKGSGIAIKTHLNTYIVQNGNGISCTASPSNGNQIWRIQILSSTQQPVAPSNSIQNPTQINPLGQTQKTLDLSMYTFPSPYSLPKAGDRCYFHRGGMFIGNTRDFTANVSLVSAPLSYEKWIVQSVGNKFAFKQQVSGFYLGSDVRDNESPKLAGGRLANEEFTVERRGNGIAFKSRMNTYLTQDGTELKWRHSPRHGWEVFYVWYDQPILQNERYGFDLGNVFNMMKTNHQLPSAGEPFCFGQGSKYVGGSKDLNSQLRFVDKPLEWERFYFQENQKGTTVALRQAVSGLYLGGKIQNNTHPLLVPHRGDWQQYTVQSRANRNFSIRSRENTYLTSQNGRLVWKSDVGIGADIWACARENSSNNVQAKSNSSEFQPQGQSLNYQQQSSLQLYLQNSQGFSRGQVGHQSGFYQ